MRPVLNLIGLAALCLLPCLAQGEASIATLGLNLYRDTPSNHPFWKACGYNTLEFLDQSWWYAPSQHNIYFTNFAQEIAAARADGFKVYVILLTNLQQWPGPAATAPADYLTRFDPANTAQMAARLDYLKTVITRLAGADGFILLAGDPGGNSESFNTTAEQFNSMARAVRSLVFAHAGANKDFLVNNWAISYWMNAPTSAFTRPLWDEQIAGAKLINNAPDLIGALTGLGGRTTGIAYSFDNYYRPLALGLYAASPAPPMERYPLAADVANVASRGVVQQWAWPYFLLDEADEGTLTGSWGKTQAEVRYIRQLVDNARAVGLNGIIGNLSFAGREAEVLNAYALARFCRPTTATTTQASVDDVYREFSRLMATAATTHWLFPVLRFIENKSTWHAAMPPEKRLPALDDGNTLTAWRGLVRLRRVQPNESPAFPLPEPPRVYLKRVENRLKELAQNETTLTLATSVDAEGGELFGFRGTNWAGDGNTQGGLDAALSSDIDRATIVVSTNVNATGFVSRFDQPLILRRSHAPETLRLGYRRNALQHDSGRVYWDDVLLGMINAHGPTEGLATVDLPLPTSLRNDWAAFAAGPHLLTLEVPYQPAQSRYFEVDALWIADTARRYEVGHTWDLTADYDTTTATLEDAGSANLERNRGLSHAAPNGMVWMLGYSTSLPFNPVRQSFNPARVAPLSAEVQAGYIGLCHTEPAAPRHAEIGQILSAYSAASYGKDMALYAKGFGSGTIPAVGQSISPAIIAFTAPQTGEFDVTIRLRGRFEGWHAAATVYREAAMVGARQTSFNGSAMAFDLKTIALRAGERLFLVIEGMSNGSWSEVLIEQMQVRFASRGTSAKADFWTGYGAP